jgi:hypothetical protein
MVNLSFSTLAGLYRNGETLCCHSMRAQKHGIEHFSKSSRYSAISLIGLLSAMHHGFSSPVATSTLMQRLIEEAGSDDNIGNLGLVLWAASMMEEREQYEEKLLLLMQRLPAAVEKVNASMELEWLLTGLCKLHMTGVNIAVLEDSISRCYTRLLMNFREESDLFCGQRSCRIKGRWKKNICYFSDQVYGIYSLCTYHEAFGDRAPLDYGIRIANKLCSLQGDKGQWPWLYDSHTGTIISMYPVYSVHQDAMAPMALFKLSDVSGVDFTPNIMRGLSWVFGDNELGIPLTDFQRGVIWRSIRKETKLSCKYALRMIKLIHIAGLDWLRDLANPFLSYAIDMECRPYHLGWLLVAFSGRY